MDSHYVGHTANFRFSSNDKHNQIYFKGEPILGHNITAYQFNYHEDNRVNFSSSDFLKGSSKTKIKQFITEHLSDDNGVWELL